MITFKITVWRSVTVFPRILQVLSRRGCIVESMCSDQNGENESVITLRVSGDPRWYTPLPDLLRRIVDVQDVQVVSMEAHNA